MNRRVGTVLKIPYLLVFLALTFIPALTTPAFCQDELLEIGSFIYHDRQDVFDDSDRSSIFTIQKDGDGILVWRCSSDELDVLLGLDAYFIGKDDQIRVRYRFDSDPVTSFSNWSLSTSNTGAFMQARKVNVFSNQAMVSNKIAVEAVDPYDQDRERYIFELDGLEEALKLLTCAGHLLFSK